MTRRIHPTAQKHGVNDGDIDHAIEFAKAVYLDEDDDRVLYLGPDNAANMIEVVSLLTDDGELVIHAMSMQRKYWPLLRGLGGPHV